jgi:X-Pro dipeptidyl-peptidase
VLVDYGPAGSAVAPAMVTRGWFDPQNRASIAASRPIQKGRAYEFRWDRLRLPGGPPVGLVVISTDHNRTIRPDPGTPLTLRPSASRIELPVVGDPAALGP